MSRMLTSRRRFLAGAACFGASLGRQASSHARERPQPPATRPRPSMPRRVRPPRLRPGDTIGIVAPATATYDPIDLDIVRETIEGLGLRAKMGRMVLERRAYFAGSDEQRAADVNEMFADRRVKGIFALRGGWGCSRVLPHLDYDVIGRNPKVLLGYSDITALLAGIHARTGLVTFHGPVAISRWNTFNVDVARRVLFEGEAARFQNVRERPEGELAQREYRVRTLTRGVARGRLVGGNLTVLTTMLGSPYVPSFEDAILFLEDTDEAPYRVDRMFTQLRLAGVLSQLKGFVFGYCTDCEPGKGTYASLTLDEILRDHVAPLGIPAWHGAMIGHIPKQFTLPIGIDAEVDATAGTIRLLEAAVS